MRAYVYSDKSLERYAGRFVWLSINTEDAKNAQFVGKYKIPALPTMFVIDPSREVVTARYIGGMTTTQLGKFLDEVRMQPRVDADATLAAADHLATEGKQEEAAKLYAKALEQAPKNWQRFNRAAEGLLVALSFTGQNEECAKRALELYPRLRGTPAGASVATAGLGCAAAIKNVEQLAVMEKATRESLDNPKISISADDRSGMYITLIDAAPNEEAAGKLRQEWIGFLESSAAAAKSAEQRAVYDSHRLSAYLDLGTPEKAIPMLEQSQRDFPKDYNPPARLAVAYRAMKEYDKALAASDRALQLAYGPRKIGYYRTRADIYNDKGDRAAAAATMREAVAYAKSLPKEQQRASTIAALEKRVKELEQ